MKVLQRAVLLATAIAFLAASGGMRGACGRSLKGVDSVEQALPVMEASEVLEHYEGAISQRQLRAFPLLASASVHLMDALLGASAGTAMGALFSSQTVPPHMAVLAQQSLDAIRDIVGDEVSKEFNKRDLSLLAALGDDLALYSRKKDLHQSRDDVEDLVARAGVLEEMFKVQAPVVGNQAYQEVVAIRIALLVELHNIDIEVGESADRIGRHKHNIRRQAVDAFATMTKWLHTFKPATSAVRLEEDHSSGEKTCRPGIFAGKFKAGSRTCHKSWRRVRWLVWMDVGSPGLVSPKPFYRLGSWCRSKHTQLKYRKRRIQRCLRDNKSPLVKQVQEHLDSEGLEEFRLNEHNRKAVFGEAYQHFLTTLTAVMDLDFSLMSLPHPTAAPAPHS